MQSFGGALVYQKSVDLLFFKSLIFTVYRGFRLFFCFCFLFPRAFFYSHPPQSDSFDLSLCSVFVTCDGAVRLCRKHMPNCLDEVFLAMCLQPRKFFVC